MGKQVQHSTPRGAELQKEILHATWARGFIFTPAQSTIGRDENTLTLTFVGDLDFQYNSCILMCTSKLNNIEKNIMSRSSLVLMQTVAH